MCPVFCFDLDFWRRLINCTLEFILYSYLYTFFLFLSFSSVRFLPVQVGSNCLYQVFFYLLTYSIINGMTFQCHIYFCPIEDWSTFSGMYHITTFYDNGIPVFYSSDPPVFCDNGISVWYSHWVIVPLEFFELYQNGQWPYLYVNKRFLLQKLLRKWKRFQNEIKWNVPYLDIALAFWY